MSSSDRLGGGLPPPHMSQPARPSVVVTPSTGRSILRGVDQVEAGVALVLVKGDDGVLRPQTADYAPAEHTHPEPWGDRVRFATTDPDPEGAAPIGAVHVNALTGLIYRKGEQPA